MHGTRVRYSCSEGWEMEGIAERECDNGHWTGSTPACRVAGKTNILRTLHKEEVNLVRFFYSYNKITSCNICYVCISQLSTIGCRGILGLMNMSPDQKSQVRPKKKRCCTQALCDQCPLARC